MPLVPVVDPNLLVVDANGVIRINGSRITLDTIALDTIATAFLEGVSAEEIKEQYPSLQLIARGSVTLVLSP